MPKPASSGTSTVAPQTASSVAPTNAPDTPSPDAAFRRYSLGEEIANSVSHGIGAGLSVAALVLLIVRSVSHGGGVRLAAALVMGTSLILLYLFSTLYHALVPYGAKRVFRILDHCGIYLLIAGSYVPFSLITLADRGGTLLSGVVWGAALLGIALECVLKERQPKWLVALIYVCMGWAVVFHIPDLYELLPHPAFWLVFAGGISYTAGAALYIPKNVPYLHFVFHLFVLAGSICITLSALIFVI